MTKKSKKNAVYQKLIIKNLYFKKALSCLDLSVLMDKSLPLITKLLLNLASEGQVVEKGFAKSTGGRKPLLFALKPGLLYVVAIAMDQFVTSIAIMNMQNEFVGEIKKLNLPLLKNERALDILVETVKQMIDDSKIPLKKFAGIGIGMPGFIDVKRGVNLSYSFAGGDDIATYIKEALNMPVYLDNDSSIMALAELKFGKVLGAESAMIINIGWGTGCGIILNGKLYRGANGFAGEFSHVPLLASGKLCFCGKRGCLETEGSLLIVIEKAREGLLKGQHSKLKDLPLDDLSQACENIIKAAKEGDQFAIELLRDSGFKTGMGIALLIHIFNPELIILSGRGAAEGKLLSTPVQQAIHEYCIPGLAEHTSIVISELGQNAELIGAASLVMENYDTEILALQHKKQGRKILG